MVPATHNTAAYELIWCHSVSLSVVWRHLVSFGVRLEDNQDEVVNAPAAAALEELCVTEEDGEAAVLEEIVHATQVAEADGIAEASEVHNKGGVWKYCVGLVGKPSAGKVSEYLYRVACASCQPDWWAITAVSTFCVRLLPLGNQCATSIDMCCCELCRGQCHTVLCAVASSDALSYVQCLHTVSCAGESSALCYVP